jgi:uncharacterized protein YjbI with pentapeptide repeats
MENQGEPNYLIIQLNYLNKNNNNRRLKSKCFIPPKREIKVQRLKICPRYFGEEQIENKNISYMEEKYIVEEIFNKINFTQNPLAGGEYESCTFINCDFSNSDLTDIKFVECGFESCNLSMAKLTRTALRDVTFRKLMPHYLFPIACV